MFKRKIGFYHTKKVIITKHIVHLAISAVTRLENVRQSSLRGGKKLGFQLSHNHPQKHELSTEG